MFGNTLSIATTMGWILSARALFRQPILQHAAALSTPALRLRGASCALVRKMASKSSSSSTGQFDDNNPIKLKAAEIPVSSFGNSTNGDSFSEKTAQETELTNSGVLGIDPKDVDIVAENQTETTATLSPDMLRRLPFVSMFRGSANYIANHRNTLAVYHIPGALLDLPDPNVFRDLMNDIALTWLLGMKIVIVAGCRHQVQNKLGDQPDKRSQGLRVTDAETLRIIKEEAGYVRFEVERQLARSLRMQRNGQEFEGSVVSTNFYSAQPFGILDGIDYQFTGFVRRVEVEKIRQLHETRDICLLTTLGVSPSGEVFNVNSECLAARVAGALGASKVLYFTEKDMELKHRVHKNKIQSLRLSDARALLDYYGLKCDSRGFVKQGNEDLDEDKLDVLLRIGWGMQALSQGVKRAHIISPKFGAVLQELYTRDGSGTLLSGDLYEGIRRATVHDVSGIHDLISPLIQKGTLVDRPKATLEREIDHYYVLSRDNFVVACGQLKLFPGGFAEIGCLVVSKDYRSRGRGDAMLGYLERLALINGASTIFVLSTQTMEWFLERGFGEAPVSELPEQRQELYNHRRASKIYLKKIESQRDLDASELWWNR
mmetsp:Transcript_26970/g.63193  ORF Transcript_26970/g.63193 Transcript_26970/m.63193 type:complete len:602 (+) Transcript_26970:176-1981(+)